MENNQNYNENNTNTNTNAGSASDAANANSRQESSSAYGYSYINQEQKNPNNIWRADENTASAYNSSSSGSTYDTQSNAGGYQNSQMNTGSAYDTQSNANGAYQYRENDSYGQSQSAAGNAYNSQTGSSYNSGQSDLGNAYGSGQTGSTYHNTQTDSSAYNHTQTGSANAYGSGQTGSTYNSGQTGGSDAYGSANNAGGAYNGAQTGGTNAYNGTQSNADSAQSGTNHSYSSIYGNAGQQSSWNSQNEAKRQKREERARRRAEKHAGSSSGFGIKLAKCASIALIFGLVAGTTFEGSSYLVGGLLGTNDQKAEDTVEQDREVLHTTDGSEQTVRPASTGMSEGVEGIVEDCMPSIVAITNMSVVQSRNFFGQVQNYEVPSAGSGIIVSEDNDYLYIATNNHVVSQSNTLTIQFIDSKSVAAEIKGTDASTDLAVVQVKKSDIDKDTLDAIKVATLGNSDVKVGSRAIAIGNALGYGQSVTVGYISAVEREVTIQDDTTGESYTNDLIQTDAAINPGNSGGALLNASGEVIGINSSKYSDTTVEGMGFAIPSNLAKQVIEDLITKEEVSEDKAAYLGIYGENVTSQIAEAYNMPEGVFVKEVIKGSAADQYGIKAGDIITKFDGKEVQTMKTLQSRLAYYEGGTEVEVVLQRASESGYQEMTLSVVLGKKNS